MSSHNDDCLRRELLLRLMTDYLRKAMRRSG